MINGDVSMNAIITLRLKAVPLKVIVGKSFIVKRGDTSYAHTTWMITIMIIMHKVQVIYSINQYLKHLISPQSAELINP